MARKPLRATPNDGVTIPLDTALRNADDNFIELYAGGGGGEGGAVASVNGETGIVVLDKSDIGLGNVDNTSDAAKNAATATLTNKTLTSPVINTPTGLAKSDVGLGNVDNTSDATKNSAVATLTNKTLTSPVINTPTGIVKGDVGLGSVDNTSDATKNSDTATLTNKTISGASNTLSSIGNSSLTNSAVTLNGTSLSLGGTRTLGLASSDFANQGTTTTVLHGNAAGNPSFGAVSLTADVSGVLPLANTDLSTARTWTGVHTYSLAEPRLLFSETDQGTDLKLWDLDLNAGVFTLRTRTDADGAGVNAIAVTRGATTAISNIAFGNATNNPTGTWLGTGAFAFGGSITVAGNSTFTGQGSISGGIATFGRLVPTSASTPTNGMNLPASNTVGLSTNSTLRVRIESTGQVALQTVGAGLSIAEGSNAKMGVATLVGGTVVVSTTAVTANSRIVLTGQSLGTVSVPSGYGVSARTAGTSFTILASAPTDTSTVAWMIVEPS